MAIWAIINTADNICDNTVVGDEGADWGPPPDHYRFCIDGLEVGIGWTYDPANNAWTPPPSPPAPVVSTPEGGSV